MTKNKETKEIILTRKGDKIYVDELVKEIIKAKKHVLKELAYR
ncbi:MAG: hypothetical protein Q7S22_04685 [Candidatus Micrarchaeota archaeon]|nr:hypothetical protein [Candidatus Micrarchaeota archaeon]